MTLRHHPIAAQRERNARLREQAERLAGAIAVDSAAGPIPVAMVPANTRETTFLPAETRESFLERLRVTVTRVFSQAPGDAPEPPTAAAEASLAAAIDSASGAPTNLSMMLGRSCATCRGECCTAGGDHAFLRDDSIERMRVQHPAFTAEAMLAAYAEQLPARHYRGSCVYHTPDGCALPRDMRSNLCNRYVCGGLTQLTNALAATGSRSAFVAAADSVHLRRMALIEPTDSTPIALS